MVHGRTYYKCECFRFGCPCCTDGKAGAEPNPAKDLILPEFCSKHGGPPEKPVQRYEKYDHVLDGGKTEPRVRKVKEPADVAPSRG